MDALDIERASLLGNSMGGGVALTVALREPSRVDRLVLMGPWVHGAVLRVYSPKPSSLLSSYYPEPSLEKMRELISAMVYDSTSRAPRNSPVSDTRSVCRATSVRATSG